MTLLQKTDEIQSIIQIINDLINNVPESEILMRHPKILFNRAVKIFKSDSNQDDIIFYAKSIRQLDDLYDKSYTIAQYGECAKILKTRTTHFMILKNLIDDE